MLNFSAETVEIGEAIVALPLSFENSVQKVPMKTYFGFGIAPSMFPPACSIRKQTLSVEEAKGIIGEGVVSCLNPSHKASIDVMQSRFGISVEIPPKAPSVVVQCGERALVMGVSGLPRLENRHEYTSEEVAGAKFNFALFTVTE
ncbi:MAG: hypothetical protein A3A22_03700 [Candidatus Taylorbacteria bacterium RIFCSPLOWO2_01_FULL_45_34b]|nr:MAG: hypothetical protein A3A22_03700 [Candidatus Taylorbacteria bacterium RIFCSPLOWO2_01_FULL_45_34b]